MWAHDFMEGTESSDMTSPSFSALKGEGGICGLTSSGSSPISPEPFAFVIRSVVAVAIEVS